MDRKLLSFVRSTFYVHKSRWCIVRGAKFSAGRELYKKFLLSIVKLVSLIKHALGIRRRRGSRANPSALSLLKDSLVFAEPG